MSAVTKAARLETRGIYATIDSVNNLAIRSKKGKPKLSFFSLQASPNYAVFAIR